MPHILGGCWISVLDFSIVQHQIGKNLYLERCSILDWGCLGWRCLQNSDAHRWNGQESASWYTHVWKAARLLPRACRRLHAVSSTGQYWLVLASTGEVLSATGQYIISETLSQICCCVTIICMCVVLHCNCNWSNPDFHRGHVESMHCIALHCRRLHTMCSTG